MLCYVMLCYVMLCYVRLDKIRFAKCFPTRGVRVKFTVQRLGYDRLG